MTDDSITPEPGRFAYEDLDRVMHEKARLGILAALAVHRDGLSFNDLKGACSLTDGNLSRHLTVLSEARLVSGRKRSGKRRRETRYALTAHGQARFASYVELLGRIAAEAALAEREGRGRSGPSTGLSPA